jgi:3',5'-cyclic AMP phosphodiesterase CpdA
MFRQGPCAFLVLDGGEDKPDSSGEYFDTADFDAYRAAELEWLKQAVKDPAFTSARWRVVLIHIPTILHVSPWYCQQWLCDNVLPVLNGAGVDLMLSGHHHRYIYVDPRQDGNQNDFPIIVNSNVDRLDFKADDKHLDVKVVDADGKEIHAHSYSK